jgi:hypothetical protein
MIHPQRTRRTYLPLALLLGGLLGAGPFVPRTFGAVEPAAVAALDVPGLAGLLGLALAVAALAGIVLSRRGDRQPSGPTANGANSDDAREVDPLLAALRGPAAFAPDDLDARLGVRTSTGSPASAGDGPRWVRRIEPGGDDRPASGPGDPSDGWQAISDREVSRP